MSGGGLILTPETCRWCGNQIPIDARGRLVKHGIGGTVPVNEQSWRNMPGPRCDGSGYPSREEARRRRIKRQARADALLAELAPEAPAALDAFLEGRPEYADRIPDFRRAALLAWNRRNQERRRWPVERANEPGGCGHDWACLYCGRDLTQHESSDGVSPSWFAGADYAAKVCARHLTECALRYLTSPEANVPDSSDSC